MFGLPGYIYKYSARENMDTTRDNIESTSKSSTKFSCSDVGYEPNRFVNLGDFSEDLSCPICFGIFRQPITTNCRHVFCKNCINTWSMKSLTCPVDRRRLTKLCKPPILIENMLNKLLIKCDYEQFGCEEIIELPLLEQHIKCCHFKPKESKMNRFFHRIFD